MPEPASSFTLAVTIGKNSFSASGKHDLVLKAFEEFKALTGRSKDPAAPTVRAPARKAEPAGSSATMSAPAGVPLPAYIKTLKLSGNKERATAILVWAAENGKDRLTTSEIEREWKKTNLKPPANLSRDLGLAAKEGWIALEGKGNDQAWMVHGFGKQALAGWGTADDKG